MVVRLHICFQPRRPVMKTHLGQQPVFGEGTDIFVNSCQRDRWNLAANSLIHSLGTGMSFHTGENVPNHLPLVRDRETLLRTQVTGRVISHNKYYCWIIPIVCQVAGIFSLGLAAPDDKPNVSSKHTFQPRYGSPVSVTALGRRTRTSVMPGTLLRSDGRVLTVTASAPLLPGTAVRLDVDGGLVLGEVVGAEMGTSRSYLSVKIDQVIPSMSELASLVQQVMDAARGGPERKSDVPQRVGVFRAANRGLN